MNKLILECNNLLQASGLDCAFCGGHALDIYVGHTTRPHGDIDVSAYWEDRNDIIAFMQSQGWLVYEAMGDGKVHLITDTNDQKLVKSNIFCAKRGCSFFHVELIEGNIYKCDIGHVEQKDLDFIEFLFNRRTADAFVYSRNKDIQRSLDKAILHKNDISYLAPELVLLYKSTDLARKQNRQDFDLIYPLLPYNSQQWLKNALAIAFPDGHEWRV